MGSIINDVLFVCLFVLFVCLFVFRSLLFLKKEDFNKATNSVASSEEDSESSEEEYQPLLSDSWNTEKPHHYTVNS